MSGPAHPSSSARGGLVGNRLPSLDPKTAGMVGLGRKVSESKGLIGNRIPSGVASVQKSAASARSASPSGSVDSSTASGANTSGSPITSRSSSPPSSPGIGLPNSAIPDHTGLLSATEPDNGGPGAMTPSSTRAEAGDEVSQFSAPSTPIQGPAATSGHYDLVPPNLKLASGESAGPSPAQIALNRASSTLSNVGSAAGEQSLSSSRVSEYDPSSQGSENPQTMLDSLSDVSTPLGTPKAELRRFEGSLPRGEGSVVDDKDFEDIAQQLDRLGVEGNEGGVDRDPTPEARSVDDSAPIEAKEGGFVKASELDGQVIIDDEPEKESAAPPNPNDLADPSAPSKEQAQDDIPIESEDKIEHAAGPELDEDPNKADDLADLKAGKLQRAKDSHGTHTVDQNPINNMTEAGIAMGLDEQIVPPSEQKEQGGVAGQRIEDIEQPTSIEPPKEAQSNDYAASEELDVRTATSTSGSRTDPSKSEGDSQSKSNESGSTAQQQELNLSKEQMPDIIEGKRASGLRLDDAVGAGAGPLTSGDTDQLKDHLNAQRREEAEKEKKEEEEEGGEGSSAMEGLQTEEDRDEGKSRREQLIEALDQNKDADKDLEDGLDEAQKEKAKAVTGKMTEEIREQEEEGEPEGEAEKKVAEGKGEKKEVVQADDLNPDAGKADLGAIEKDLEEESKPKQVQVEPAPIAQRAEDTEDGETETASATNVKPENEPETHAAPSSPPAFPSPPQEDPDVVDPLKPSDDATEAGDDAPLRPATPVDSAILKSFPDVPDEDKPRVEVHVNHSPVNSPIKGLHGDHPPETPPAKVREESESPSTRGLTKGDVEQQQPEEEGKRDSLEVDGTPEGAPEKLAKRSSTKKSPKSPLLDDEDPGDFEPGEGWAVVTK